VTVARRDVVPVPKLLDVDGLDRDVLVECARQVRAIRDATPKGRPMYRHLSAQLELLDAAVARYDT
jgi:hypothetical protein